MITQNFEKILNNILETKNAAVIVLDTNLNILYLSKLATKISSNKNDVKKLSDFYVKYDIKRYREILKSAEISDRKIIRINKKFFMSTLCPIVENGIVEGLIEILDAEDENYRLSYEIKNIHKKAYENSQLDNAVEINNGTVYSIDSIITKNIDMLKLKERAYKTADSSSPVLIYGETGTGKELFAQGIHNASIYRRNNMFIAQNCAAIPETLLESILFGTTEGSFTGAKDKPGLFEIAEGGTIYLDEINSMDLNLQAKLLRVLQENTYRPIGSDKVKKANVRIIASFNKDPLSVIKEGKFRRDLYYRLNVIYFKIPGLSDRKEDIKLLTDYFINIYNKKFNKNINGVEKEAMNILEKHKWDGNVRELKNSIERIMNFIDGDLIKIEDITNFIVKDAINKESDSSVANNFTEPENIKNKISVENKSLKEIIETVEIKVIRDALNNSGGNIALAARILKMPRQTLKNKIIKYSIRPIY